MHKLKTLVGACTVALATLGTAATAQAATWRYAFEEAITDVQGVYATKFKEHIEANSDHNIQLFPYGTLGESADTMEQAQAGLLQFVDQSPGFTGSLIPEAQVFFIPYLLPETHEALDSFFRNSNAINEDFKEIYAQHGLELLKMFPEGEVVITTQEPFEKPADLNGVKIRVMTNPLLVESYKAFGATPTPLAWGEVYGGLQTNIIQGQENPLFWVESAKMYEVSDVITFTGHNNFTTAVMANKRFFDGLPEADQALIHEAMDVAFDHIMEYQKGLSERSLEKIFEQKPEIEVVRLTEEQRAPFRAAAKEVEAKYIEMTGDSGKALLEQLKQDLEAATAE
ncbi:C4-dicarboxylate ABC transporter [Marinobacterium iners]|uniref:TRAP transporter substrate-binding protein n=1 Tax=Marinobacterium iners TaxID=48076 RepID=UPI001A8D750F|nr:TRAP transporter substrate-binding protein DctP [Marinobacterium iners]QSR33528.1 C4-dicarboxylate ABC transporter [Marinobacterium iners]